jgi:hypothetical protein
MNKKKEAIWKTEREREQIPNAMLLEAPTTLFSQPHEQLQNKPMYLSIPSRIQDRCPHMI